MRPAAAMRFASLMAVISMTGAAGTGLAQDATTPLAADACAALLGLSVPASAIGLPTQGAVVQSAAAVAASAEGNANGASARSPAS